jgi:hypothetical protein
MVPLGQKLGDEIKELLQLEFTAFCKHSNVGLYKRPDVPPLMFVEWLKTQNERRRAALDEQPAYGAADKPDPAHKVFSTAATEYVYSIPYRCNGLMGLMAFWPYLVLAHRDSAHPVRAMSVGALIHYEDGTVASLHRFVRAGILSSTSITDADLASVIYARMPEVGDMIQRQGGDKLHDLWSSAKGCFEGDVFQYIVALLNAARHTPEMAAKLQGFMSFLQVSFVGALAPAELRKVCDLCPDPAADAALEERSKLILRGGNAEGV